jgi:hypothetical protein
MELLAFAIILLCFGIAYIQIQLSRLNKVISKLAENALEQARTTNRFASAQHLINQALIDDKYGK